MNKEKAIGLLQNAPMFRYFSQDAIEALCDVGKIISYNEGEYIIREAELEEALYIIISGSVCVTVSNEEKEVYICTIGDGEVVGEAGIFTKVKRTANIKADVATVALALSRECLLNFLKKNPTSGTQLLMIVIYSLIKKLRGVNQDLAFVRKDDITQDDIDSIIKGILSDV